ncbi:hypothetical protein SPOG_05714 [Schizosaccharomyces cryophilus OY26]|uniref:Uncharacterized protein n=1 Tax=Schizosaccharomyces cryophilus (strain OY26 / ATCC MYA-4695 / CBS 11777 / NBRC 106824 / NRRL Y48691) TaxID=653667 RepID=S9W4W8_SCHCR|nr:uncharacterized protein SPOG_05714 [Schizosaccharomyces cryophilus OY26]EPY53574.1 hypothetical protein SPOG_05714 [Schizosaccharomyces cryophilus OY26]
MKKNAILLTKQWIYSIIQKKYSMKTTETLKIGFQHNASKCQVVVVAWKKVAALKGALGRQDI